MSLAEPTGDLAELFVRAVTGHDRVELETSSPLTRLSRDDAGAVLGGRFFDLVVEGP